MTCDLMCCVVCLQPTGPKPLLHSFSACTQRAMTGPHHSRSCSRTPQLSLLQILQLVTPGCRFGARSTAHAEEFKHQQPVQRNTAVAESTDQSKSQCCNLLVLVIVHLAELLLEPVHFLLCLLLLLHVHLHRVFQSLGKDASVTALAKLARQLRSTDDLQPSYFVHPGFISQLLP